ncbi:hypothetical protein [Azospirillum sp. SYSU D00513]|uniref:hypothetical protein n=1 Tax=Azospirillum sp. SYSU D00513 TaxID=2812561 RepID=UPI001A974D27|nr:hypothetical protein [Azospirillum sp. SYSU D00513]
MDDHTLADNLDLRQVEASSVLFDAFGHGTHGKPLSPDNMGTGLTTLLEPRQRNVGKCGAMLWLQAAPNEQKRELSY